MEKEYYYDRNSLGEYPDTDTIEAIARIMWDQQEPNPEHKIPHNPSNEELFEALCG